MRSQSENPRPDASPANSRPIELLTENGFSILRLWEIRREPAPAAGGYAFLVRNPEGLERKIVVQIAGELATEIELRTMRRVLAGSTFWICCAERHLADYLWKQNEYPNGDQLNVELLDSEDQMLAIRWGTT